MLLYDFASDTDDVLFLPVLDHVQSVQGAAVMLVWWLQGWYYHASLHVSYPATTSNTNLEHNS